ncbi:hypothetical protein CPLU01_13244 [Colletotrichum plurivorum]|uniref:Uncharacterized protein n=1 Tax=Colletotrichum plurivorum TaxID=2175906 RepID=A0A8H6JSL9_9PEZI|nr:hypothetical protein CPLU01_13244 [Colletotrichum plurivorum]
MAKVRVDLKLDHEAAYVADLCKAVQRITDEQMDRILKKRGGKQSGVAHDGFQLTTPAEILRAAIESDMPPLDPITAQAYRFDRAYQVKDMFALLGLYRVLVRTLNLDPVDIQKWIEQDTMIARLDGLQKKHATTTDTPADLAARPDWFLQHKYVFDDIGTEEDHDAVYGSGHEGIPLRLRLMQEDMDARAEDGEYIAYILTRPHVNNKIVMLYSHQEHGPPVEVKTMRMDADRVTRLARTGQTYAEAVSSAERDYLEAQESKKKREADAATGKQAKNQ